MADAKEKVATSLSPLKKNMVIVGCMCLMLFITMVNASVATIMGPILTKMEAMQWFSLLTVFSTLGLAVMNPIGGKLGDLLGRRNIVVIFGIIAFICTIGMGVAKSFLPFAIFRLVLGVAQGAFMAAPYIIVREINEARNVPKAMGMLASAMAVGNFGGSIFAGFFMDKGYTSLAIIFPVIPLAVAVITVGINFPNKRRETVKVDVWGIIYLVVLLSAMTLTLNFGGRIGWTNPLILLGFLVMVVFGVVLVKAESRISDAIIPVYLFKNKRFVVLLLIGLSSVYYQTVMKAYVPLVVQQVMNQSATVAGALQVPRTLLTMALPTIVGVWVGKKASRSWVSIALATGLAGLAFLPLVFVNASTPVMIFFVGIGVTGIAESFRSVSITPVAQAELEKKDLGVGTSLITFMNTVGALICAAVSGVLLDAQGSNVQAGFSSVALVTVIVSFVGCILAFVFIRPLYRRKE